MEIHCQWGSTPSFLAGLLGKNRVTTAVTTWLVQKPSRASKVTRVTTETLLRLESQAHEDSHPMEFGSQHFARLLQNFRVTTAVTTLASIRTERNHQK